MTKFNAAFWRWFGDSKVVDERGQPLVVYHATTADFSVFDVKRGQGIAGRGIYMTNKPPQDDKYGDVVYPLFASIKHPADFSAGDGAISDYAESKGIGRMTDQRGIPELKEWSIALTKALLNDGFDGAVLMGEDGATYFVAYAPTQVKSATGNDGTWDVDDPDIRSNPPLEDQHLSLGEGAYLTLRLGSPERWRDVWPDDVVDVMPDPVAVISNIGVSPKLRGQGIGSKLTRQAIKIASDLGIEAVYLRASPKDGDEQRENLHRFYERLGFEPTGEEVHGDEIFSLGLPRDEADNPPKAIVLPSPTPEDWRTAKAAILELMSGGPVPVVAYRCGMDFLKLREDDQGTSEGMAALGPGVYFTSEPEYAEKYCKYAEAPVYYEVSFPINDFHCNNTGSKFSEALKKTVVHLAQELGHDPNRMLMHTSLRDGSYGIAGIKRMLGETGARKVFREIGLKGTLDILPWSIEFAVFDTSIITVHHRDDAPDVAANPPPSELLRGAKRAIAAGDREAARLLKAEAKRLRARR